MFTAIVVGSKGDKSLVYSFVLQGIHLYTRRTHFGVRVSENISVAAVAFLESFLHQQDLTHYNCLVFSSSVQVRSAAKSRKLTVQTCISKGDKGRNRKFLNAVTKFFLFNFDFSLKRRTCTKMYPLMNSQFRNCWRKHFVFISMHRKHTKRMLWNPRLMISTKRFLSRTPRRWCKASREQEEYPGIVHS